MLFQMSKKSLQQSACIIVMMLTASVASAQQPAKPPAAKPAAPAQGQSSGQPAAPAGPTIVQVKPEPSQTQWTKVCGKDPANGSEICYTTRDFISDQGQAVLAIAIYDIKGAQPQRIVRALMPLGLLLQPGVRFSVDKGDAIQGRYAICFPNGCFAEAPVSDSFINALKKGGTLNVSIQNQVAQEVSFAVPASDFGKGFDGPAIDPKVLEEQQKKLQEELEKRSEAIRKQQESQSATPPAKP